MKNKNHSSQQTWLFMLAGFTSLLVIVLCVGVFLSSQLNKTIIFLEPNQKGVVLSPYEKTGYRSEVLEPGLHILKIGESVEIMEIGRQAYTNHEDSNSGSDSLEVKTNDGQTVQVELSVVYAVDPEAVLELYQSWGNRYHDELVRPASHSITRNILKQYTLNEISAKRAEIEETISEHISTAFSENHLILVKFTLLGMR